MARVSLDRRALERAVARPGGPLMQAMERAGRRVANQAKRNLTSGSTSAVDTGRLRASIGHEVRVEGSRVIARVGTDVGYGLFVHEGTPLGNPGGIIRPRRAKVLRFPAGPGTPPGRVSSDGFVYARSVRGMKPRPYLRKALDDLRLGDIAP